MRGDNMTDTEHRLAFDGRTLRDAFGKFPSGVVAVCARDAAGDPVGMAVSAFMPVSLDPPLLSICLQKTSSTWPRLAALPAVGVSVLSRDQKEHAQRLASKDGDRFAGISTVLLPSGAVVLDRSHAWFECEIRDSHDAGDHVIVVLTIVQLSVEDEAEDPMVFFGSRFRGIRHLGGKPETTLQFDMPIPPARQWS
jgi:flavin reductase (DIM6/NTAB) family NADH-FMN oxidoreductase RutF